MGYRDLTGFTVESTARGQAVARITVTDDHLNRGGIMHGGAIATICDSAMGHAVGTTLEPGTRSATATMSVTYLSSALPGDELAAQATVRKRGRTAVVVEVDVVRQSDDRQIACAIATFVLTPRREG